MLLQHWLDDARTRLGAETWEREERVGRQLPWDELIAYGLQGDATSPEPTPGGGAGVDSLTARECQILALLSRGGTNAEIGLELGISRGTVERHIANIYLKLGVGNRTQAAAVALQHLQPSA